jgi:lysophospholipid acyltransferase (LPLAT)-like uncharacterized protein
VAFLAGITGNPVLPYHIEANRHWTLKSWDRTQIPKPFSRVALVIGAPIRVPDASEEAIAAGLREVAESLTLLEGRAATLISHLQIGTEVS